MSPIVKNVLAVLAGLVVGSLVNMGIVIVGSSIVPPPAGADVTTMEGLKASIHLFLPKHFIMPFLAHTLGTLVGAFIAALIAENAKMKLALSIGLMFLAGGIANCFMLPAPLWYILLDLAVAYIPMAYLGGKLGIPISGPTNIPGAEYR